jgi:TPR repeat protein
VVLANCRGRTVEQQRAAALATLRTHPGWLFPAESCPADVMAETEDKVVLLANACLPALEGCVSRCHLGEAPACYALALALQEQKIEAEIPEALFLRACKLGVRSGCTNRAAGMQDDEGKPGVLSCIVRTFRKTCNQGDPWGCTMLALFLSRGQGVKQDVDEALRVLKKSCTYGDDDPACRRAKELSRRLEAGDGAASH